MPADMTNVLTAIKRGYAFVEQNERGQFFSEGVYDILGPPRTDGYDMIKWLHDQAWSNGKVGLIGCSSTAEWQLGVAATAPPGLAAIVPQGFGAGIGRMKPYTEQGNWYRGGAVQMLFIYWLHDYVQYAGASHASSGTRAQADLQIASRYFDLGAQAPLEDWTEAFRHLPGAGHAQGHPTASRESSRDSQPNVTGGRMIQRTPNDPAWFRGGLYDDDMVINVPGLYLVSWYNVSVGPNLALFNHVRQTASPAVARRQYAMIAPTGHCGYTRATEHTVVGERDEGDARWNYPELTYSWFDHFLKGEDNHLLDTLPHVRYYTMGINKWQKSDTRRPKGAQPVTYFLTSGGHANTGAGDGLLATKAPSNDTPDGFSYDP